MVLLDANLERSEVQLEPQHSPSKNSMTAWRGSKELAWTSRSHWDLVYPLKGDPNRLRFEFCTARTSGL
jgi:hypothetical protein